MTNSACEEVGLAPPASYSGQVQEGRHSRESEGPILPPLPCLMSLEHVFREPRAVLAIGQRERLGSEGVLLMTTPQVGQLSWPLMGRAMVTVYTAQRNLWFFQFSRIVSEACWKEKFGFRFRDIRPLAQGFVTVGYFCAGAYARTAGFDSRIVTPWLVALDRFLPGRAFIFKRLAPSGCI